MVVVAYYPPPQRHQIDHWNTTCAKLTAWLHRTIQRARARCMIVVGADTNSEFGRRSGPSGTPTTTRDDVHVGPFANSYENG
eukprot:2092843-Pyramimonas_sp.AAC.1